MSWMFLLQTFLARYMFFGFNVKTNDSGLQTISSLHAVPKQVTPRDRHTFMRELLHSLRQRDRFRGVRVTLRRVSLALLRSNRRVSFHFPLPGLHRGLQTLEPI